MLSYKNTSSLHSAGMPGVGSSFFLGVLGQFPHIPEEPQGLCGLPLTLTGSPNSDVPITGENLSLPC